MAGAVVFIRHVASFFISSPVFRYLHGGRCRGGYRLWSVSVETFYPHGPFLGKAGVSSSLDMSNAGHSESVFFFFSILTKTPTLKYRLMPKYSCCIYHVDVTSQDSNSPNRSSQNDPNSDYQLNSTSNGSVPLGKKLPIGNFPLGREHCINATGNAMSG